jgi:hypothetical protein
LNYFYFSAKPAKTGQKRLLIQDTDTLPPAVV